MKTEEEVERRWESPMAKRILLSGWIPAWVCLVVSIPRTCANPSGLVVQTGTATTQSSGTTLAVTVSDRAVLNWANFNIGPGEVTTFLQPSMHSIVWNQINSANPTEILGRLQANGRVVLANSQGFYFGKDAFVSAAGFAAIATASPPPGFSFGGDWTLSLEPPSAGIVNEGVIVATDAGAIYLLSNRIENRGELRAERGRIQLESGREILISDRADGRGLTMSARLDAGVIDNSGRLIADAGQIALRAQVVNQSGTISANSVRNANGVIELVAADDLNLTPGSTIQARGDGLPGSPGGRVLLKSGYKIHDSERSVISVDGGTDGGNAGSVEYSAPEIGALQSIISASARSGYAGGELIVDPETIVISDQGSSTGSGTVNAPGGAGQLNFNPASFGQFTKITLQATRDISINSPWILADLGGPNPGQISLQAGGDIKIATGASLLGGSGWAVSLSAGLDLATGKIRDGVGSLALTGSAVLASKDGDIAISAGRDVTVGSGAIRTTVGGNLSVKAGGTINAGSRPDGFLFRPTGVGYESSPTLGGISSANGGDVSLVAGRDVISLLPTLASGSHSDGGSGAFGAQPGDVSIRAGNNVVGHFVVRNGVGTIEAGGNAGEINRQLALSLVAGGWSVSAREIVLQEVRNPNGTYNRTGTQLTPTATRFAFDYSAEASVKLEASKTVTLLGAVIPRLPSLAIPILYPPSLTIKAGSGGILLGSDVTLFPSSTGQLSIETTDGGSFKSTDALEPRRLTLSDSASRRYDFESGRFGLNDHDPKLLHRNDPISADISVSGNLESVSLGISKPTTIRVAGDVIATSFVGQNLAPTDTSAILVGGNIRNRNAFTFAQLPLGTPDLNVELLELAYPPISGITLLYDPKTREVAFRGRMTEDQRALLKKLTVRELDGLGQPILLPDGLPMTRIVDFVSSEIVDALFRQSQDVPRESGNGYQVGGPGTFTVQAHNIDLGVTPGIISYGARFNPGLAVCDSRGAEIKVSVDQSLSLFSSAIASIAGGGISVHSNGSIDVGTQRDLGVTDAARGIYTAAKADVDVVAVGNIELNGSRIAAYDGGNVRVRSEHGDVNAGAGGLGFARVDQLRLVGPDCTPVIVRKAIPGSGILATTFPGSTTTLGDITVETPLGNIIASAGGIAQVSLSDAPVPGGKVKLVAGSRAPDGTLIHQGTIDASNSGVIGSDVTLAATGDIKGVVFSRGDLSINTPQSVNVVALAGGAANVSAGGSVSGTIVGIGSANVAGGAGIDANVLSQNATTSGNTQGQVGFSQTAVAGATSQAATADNQAKASAAVSAQTESVEPDSRKKPRLAKTIGRVQVILDR